MSEHNEADEFRLCFGEYPWAVFVTAENFDDLRTDDFDDGGRIGSVLDPLPESDVQYEVLRVAVRGPLENKHWGYSPESINDREMAWFRSEPHADEILAFKAKTTLSEFIRLAERAGANVHLPTGYPELYRTLHA